MTVHIEDCGMSYFSVPKCASSSLKYYFFEIQNGFAFRKFRANGVTYHEHSFFRALPYARAVEGTRDDWFKVAVIRDPIARFLSCYSNRVVHRKVLTRNEIGAEDSERGLVQDPDLSNFVRFFERYREINGDVAWHSQPLRFFLGGTPEYFGRLYTPADLGQLREDVAARTERHAELPWVKTEGPKLRRDDLSAAEVAKIEKLFEDDYEVFGKYF